MDWIIAHDLYHHHTRDKAAGKPLENNTRLVALPRPPGVCDVFGIKLYNTVVVEIYRGGMYRLRAGGFRTVTTKDRINSYCPLCHVYSRRGTWIVKTEDGECVFTDDMVVYPDGTVVSVLPFDASKAQWECQLKKRLDSYAGRVAEMAAGIRRPDTTPQALMLAQLVQQAADYKPISPIASQVASAFLEHYDKPPPFDFTSATGWVDLTAKQVRKSVYTYLCYRFHLTHQ